MISFYKHMHAWYKQEQAVYQANSQQVSTVSIIL